MGTTIGLALCLLLFHALAGRAGPRAKAAIQIRPELVLMDDVIDLQISGLSPKAKVTVRAQTGMMGKLWQAQATFVADAHGKVDLGKQAPTAGSYTGVDPMGLFWSMEPTERPLPKNHPKALQITDPRLTRLELEIDNRTVNAAEIKRWWARPGVRVTDVREQGLVGRLFEPDKPGRHPAILVLSGSEGGMRETEAALLASHGYTAFALAYFGVKGLPKDLVLIPLEYLKKGLDWLGTRDSVDGKRLGVVGGSKGAELGLLLAATFPEIKVVIATAPSHVAWSGLGGTYQESSWSYRKKPIPFVQARPTLDFFAQLAGNKPIAYRDLFQQGLRDKENVAKALIPVERIQGAILLISGRDDQLWPSAFMADKLMERLTKYKHPHPYVHLCYEGAGHGIVNAYLPMRPTVTMDRFALGGNVQDNAKALADSRPKVLRFLRENLGPP